MGGEDGDAVPAQIRSWTSFGLFAAEVAQVVQDLEGRTQVSPVEGERIDLVCVAAPDRGPEPARELREGARFPFFHQPSIANAQSIRTGDDVLQLTGRHLAERVDAQTPQIARAPWPLVDGTPPEQVTADDRL